MDTKELRLRRLADPRSGRIFIVPLDHGVTQGPIAGLDCIDRTVSRIVSSGFVNALVVHKGILFSRLRTFGCHPTVSLILHLSASTSFGPDPDDKTLVASVEEAVRVGADGVSVHVNLGAPTESKMLADLGRVAEQCNSWGMPLLAMTYLRGPAIDGSRYVERLAHAARVAEELGADIVKLEYPGSRELFRVVTDGVRIPVVIAGGVRGDSTAATLRLVEDSLAAGGAGVSLGRRIFQADDPLALCCALGRMIHEGRFPDRDEHGTRGPLPPAASLGVQARVT